MTKKHHLVPDNELRRLAAAAQGKKGELLEELQSLADRDIAQLIEWAQDLETRNSADGPDMRVLVRLAKESRENSTLAAQRAERVRAPIRFRAAQPPPPVILGTIVLGYLHEMPKSKRKVVSPYGQTWATPRKRRK